MVSSFNMIHLDEYTENRAIEFNDILSQILFKG